MIEKLKKKEFFDIYGISLLIHKGINNEVINERILYIAKKYIDITNYAVRSELRYANTGGLSIMSERTVWKTDKKYIKNLHQTRKQLSLEKIIKLFDDDSRWHHQYGGHAWANITEALIQLKKWYEKEDIIKILSLIYYLNDLEHNTKLYLQNYCSFDLQRALNYKRDSIEKHIFMKCSYNIQRYYNQTKSLVALYH